MNSEMRQHYIGNRRTQFESFKRVHIRKEREAIVDGAESIASELELGASADMPLNIAYRVNELWLESEHRIGIPLLLAMRGLAIETKLDRSVEPPVLRITRQDPEHLDDPDS